MEELKRSIEHLKKTIEEQKARLEEVTRRIMELNTYIRSIDYNIEALDERTDSEAIQWWLDQKAVAISERDKLLEEYRQLQELIKSNEAALAELERQLKETEIEEKRRELTPEQRFQYDLDILRKDLADSIAEIRSEIAGISDPLTLLANALQTGIANIHASIEAFRTALGIPNIRKLISEIFTVDAVANFTTAVFANIGGAFFNIVKGFVIPMNAFTAGLFQELIQTYTTETAEQWKRPFINVIQSMFENVTYEPPANYEKALDAASKYLSVTVTLNNLTNLIGAALDSLGNLTIFGTKIGLRGFSRWAYSLNFVLGLNWLSWLVFSPLFRSTVVEPLEQYYNQLYRSKILSVSEAEQAFRNGIINAEEYMSVLMAHGYNDDSIEVMLHNALIEIVDRIEQLEVQYADVSEDLGKVLTVTVPELEDRISSLEAQIKTAEETINKEKEYAIAKLEATYKPRLEALEKQIQEVAKPIEEKYRIELEKLEGLLKVELEKIELLKEAAKTYEEMYKLQVREYELVQEFEVKKKALLEKRDLEIAKAIEKLKTEYDKTMQAFQLELQAIETKYARLLEEKTRKLKEQCDSYTKQLHYYNTYKIPLLERKLKRIEQQIKRLKECTLMSEPEELLEEAYIQLKKKKQLVQKIQEEQKEKRTLQIK
ncbi:MAG: hypothetical protein NDF57_05155 [archaeon GBS-70-058]|nr:hypothetical protein [Candidatus Culexarchaeum nevadense]